jgi:hypothetical protein
MDDINDKKVAISCGQKYKCNICHYNTVKKSSYDKHLLTLKHSMNEKELQKIAKNASFICNCGKEYKFRQGLWKHKRTCNLINNTELPNIENNNNSNNSNNDITALTNLVLEVVKNNSDLQKQMLEVIKNGTNNHTNSHNNNNNKTFNLQFFLNEECKDALNINEFVSSIKVELEDLETTGRLGYVEGVSRIINRNLNDLDQNKRPIHCSDVKREVLYIKNDDHWIKENDTKPLLTKAIKQIANENIKQISEWKKKYPDCTDSESRKNDQYLNIVSNAMSGSTMEEQTSNYDKIIKKVAKEVVIEK